MMPAPSAAIRNAGGREKIKDMWHRFVCATVMLAWGLAAQSTLKVDQLYSFVKSSVQLKHPDKQVAVFLSRLKLSERLEDGTIIELQALGAGPRTVEALRELQKAAANLPPVQPKPVVAPSTGPPPPRRTEVEHILAEVREYAFGYSKRLPDFLCTQVTRRYEDPTGLEFWRQTDTLTARLTYFEQKEDYKLVMVNNSVVNNLKYEAVGGASSSGEFGSMLREVFDPDSQARFEWQRWATLRGKRAHVFEYRVAQPNSKWHIVYDRRMDIIAGYNGLLYVDADTNTVLRLTLVAEDIPPSFPVNEASTTLDYDYTTISEHKYLLPLRYVMRMRSGKYLSRNETEFRLYRKFTAEATITFDTPAPLPEDQTKEQPPKP
jgi:hypothetical protein